MKIRNYKSNKNKYRWCGVNNPKWNGGKIKLICQICGKEFKDTPYHMKRGRKYCSRKCYKVHYSMIMKGENSRFWKGGKVKRICQICKNEFYVKRGRVIIKKEGKFCSKKCYGIWQSKNVSGKNSPYWQGGKSFEPYSVDWTKTLKRSIRERDKYICQICENLQGDVAFSVHHIDYNKENCNSNNLITLCNKCHQKTNFNREYWKNYFIKNTVG